MKSELSTFDKNPYIIFDSFDIGLYGKLASYVESTLCETARELYDLSIGKLEDLHKTISSDQINEYRIECYKRINSLPILDLIYGIQKPFLDELLGPDLAVQKLVNLSIVPPYDKGSTIPFHSDINTGESLYELVSWIPFVDCSGTNSIFIADKGESLELHKKLHEFNYLKAPSLSSYVEKRINLTYLDIKKAQCLVFSPILFHGSNTNETNKTRVSLNLRFKSIYTPFIHNDCIGKGLDEFFMTYKKSKLSIFVDNYQKPQFA